MTSGNGSGYERVTRNMVENLKDTFDKGFAQIDARLEKIEKDQSSRLPLWVTVMFTIGGSLISSLALWTLTH